MAVYNNSVHNTGAGYTLVGIFKEVGRAEQAIFSMRAAGFSPDAMILVTTNQDEQGEVDESSYGEAKRQEGLDKIGIPASESKNYEELVENGNSLVVVNLDDQGLMPTARDITLLKAMAPARCVSTIILKKTLDNRKKRGYDYRRNIQAPYARWRSSGL